MKLKSIDEIKFSIGLKGNIQENRQIERKSEVQPTSFYINKLRIQEREKKRSRRGIKVWSKREYRKIFQHGHEFPDWKGSTKHPVQWIKKKKRAIEKHIIMKFTEYQR